MITRFIFFCFFFVLVSCSASTESYLPYFINKTLYAKYIIAHGGLWDDGSKIPFNSRAAFRKGLSLKIYGTEFDIYQTKDSIFVVNHDSIYNGMRISDTSYKELNRYLLSNGETLPRLEDFLDIAKNIQSSAKLIIELKKGDVSCLVNLIKRYKLQDRVEYITFINGYCSEFALLGYGKVTSYLGGDIPPKLIRTFGISGIDYHYDVYINNSEYIKKAKDLGMKVMTWTVNDFQQINDFMQKEVIVTTDRVKELYNIK